MPKTPRAKFEIRDSRPKALAQLNAREKKLFESFPPAFKAFYRKHNGGVCSNTREVTIPMTWQRERAKREQTPVSIDRFWSFMPKRIIPSEDGVPSILREHFGRHVGENFLPKNVFVFADTAQNSLFCISLNQHDHGSIHYWEWYWQYPWYKPFFEKRVRAAEKQKPPKGMSGDDALNYATLIPVARSFEEFLEALGITS